MGMSGDQAEPGKAFHYQRKLLPGEGKAGCTLLVALTARLTVHVDVSVLGRE